MKESDAQRAPSMRPAPPSPAEFPLHPFARLDARRLALRSEWTNAAHRCIEVDLASTDLHIDSIAADVLIGEGFNRLGAESGA